MRPGEGTDPGTRGRDPDPASAVPGVAFAPEGEGRGLPRIGFVGAGRVGLVLGTAISRSGWPVTAVASRDPGRRERFQAAVPGARAYAEPAAVLDDVDVVFLTVPDDAIGDIAAQLRLYSGQALVHTSGLLPASILEPARAAGTMVGSFHPLVAFADMDGALAALRGATVALEGDEPLVGMLAELAEAIGGQPVQVPSQGRAGYHAAAVLAAGGFVALLDAIAELARGAGLDEATSLATYAPLLRQTLANAEQLGIRQSLSGPVLRGDAGTLRAHMDSMKLLSPGAVELYGAAARREIALARARGELSEERADALRRVLEESRL